MPSTAGKLRDNAARAQAAAVRTRERLERVPRLRAGFESLATEQRSGAPLLAGGLAYRLFFWLVAFGLLTAALLSFWVREHERSAETTAKSFGLAGVAARSASSAIQDGSKARWYFLFSGMLLLVYFGMGAVRALRLAAFLAWRIEPERLRGSLKASLAFSGFLVGGLVAGLGTAWVREHGPGIGLVATICDAAVFSVLAIVAFELLPHPKLRSWRDLLPGAVVVGCGLTVMHVVVVYYFAAKLERSPSLYGALGASTVVLTWLFLLARVVVSGMFLNATLDRRRRAAAE
jgi:uncharacterized BrkB/YihY/UPF0761 family membrane protein